MTLLNLSPEIQEAILFLPRIESGREPLTEGVEEDRGRRALV